MSRHQGYVLFNSTLLTGATNAQPVRVNQGFQGAIVCRTGALLDPALHQLSVNLQMGANQGSGYVVANSSKVLTVNSLLAPLYFPAGEYVVRSAAGSSIVCSIGIYPTT